MGEPPLLPGEVPLPGPWPAPAGPDPARDARVAARRAADARKAGAALDRLLSGHGGRDVILVDAYYLGWDAGHAAQELHHNRHYGVPCPNDCGHTDCPHGDAWADAWPDGAV